MKDIQITEADMNELTKLLKAGKAVDETCQIVSDGNNTVIIT